MGQDQVIDRHRSASERPSGRAVTRADVARYAGVSTAVVSYVINNGPRPVAAQTAERVRNAIDVLGYRPNEQARALTMGRTGTLGFVVADALNPFYSEYSHQLSQSALENGQRLITVDSRQDADTEHRLIEDLLARQVDGLLFASDTARKDPMVDIRLGGVPVVLLDAPGPIRQRRTVGVAARKAARRLVEHLIEVHDHSDVALLIGDLGFASPDPRERGWWQALQSAGLAESRIARTRFTYAGGYHGGIELLSDQRPPRAIFASSDQQAIGLLRAIGDRGLRVPDDIAVVSFDGTRSSEYTVPPLTVARQPIEAMSAAAITLLDAPVDPAGTHLEFEADLIVRSSCGCGPTSSPADR